MRMERPQIVASIADEIAAAVVRPTPRQRQILDRLNHLCTRLKTSSFQLAVLGQFKRGKSTLLNALLGFPLLSTGVLPLTSVPTFLRSGATLRISLTRLTGEVDDQTFIDPGDLALAIAAATTEEHNPHNVKRLERVDVTVPSKGWLNDVTLVDTPGIGSTYSRNTSAAHAVLPECDAALFVLSVDPPITEVEVEYLSTICQTASRVVIILNKIDLVDALDRKKAMAFLASVLSQHALGKIDKTIFPVSARAALTAKERANEDGVRLSGLSALEQHLRTGFVERKRIYLEASIGKKAADILEQLLTDAAITARALELPVAELDEKIGVFENSALEFARERDNLHDLQSGEWKRALAKLNDSCAEGEKRAHRALDECFVQLGRDAPLSTEKAEISSTVYRVFDAELRMIAEAVDADLRRAVESHQRRFHDLVWRVRDTAGALMEVEVRPVDSDEWFQLKREPYWVDQARIESLSSLTADGFVRLLPRRLRRSSQQRKVRDAARTAVTRNISELRWAMHQNIDDSFRRLLFSSTQAVDASIQATREVLELARLRRQAESAALVQDLEHAQESSRRLTSLREQLASVFRSMADG